MALSFKNLSSSMSLTLADICVWAKTSIFESNFREGESLGKAGCIKICSKSVFPNGSLGITAVCLANYALSGPLHKIEGLFLNVGKISSMKCSCNAELEKKRQHVLGVLLHCYKCDFEILDELLEEHTPKPLRELPTFEHIENKITLSQELQNEFKQLILTNLASSAFAQSVRTPTT